MANNSSNNSMTTYDRITQFLSTNVPIEVYDSNELFHLVFGHAVPENYQLSEDGKEALTSYMKKACKEPIEAKFNKITKPKEKDIIINNLETVSYEVKDQNIKIELIFDNAKIQK